MVRKRADGSIEDVLDAEHVQRSRLRIDTRKWMAGKLAPKKYGEKIEYELSGQIGLRPIILGDRPPEIENEG